jgi:hypothetical protein
MERHPIPAVVVSCPTCGLIRIADDYAAAYARASAHVHLSGHHGLEYSAIDTPERLHLAEACQERSQRTVKGYVCDNIAEALVSSIP